MAPPLSSSSPSSPSLASSFPNTPSPQLKLNMSTPPVCKPPLDSSLFGLFQIHPHSHQHDIHLPIKSPSLDISPPSPSPPPSPHHHLGAFADAFAYLASQKAHWQSRAKQLQQPDPLPPPRNSITRLPKRRALHPICRAGAPSSVHIPKADAAPNHSNNRRRKSRHKSAPKTPKSVSRLDPHPPSLSPSDPFDNPNGFSPLAPDSPIATFPGLPISSKPPPLPRPHPVQKFQRGLAAQAASQLLNFTGPLNLGPILQYEPPIPYYYGDLPTSLVGPSIVHRQHYQPSSYPQIHSRPLLANRTRHSISTFSFPHSFTAPAPLPAPPSSRLPQRSLSILSTLIPSAPVALRDLPLPALEKCLSLDTKLERMRPSNPATFERPTFIFIDHSNVIWSFLRHLKMYRPHLDPHDQTRFKRKPGSSAKPKLRMDYESFFRIVERGRGLILRRYIAASNPLYQPDMIHYWESKGYETAILDPVVNRNPTTRKVGSSSRKQPTLVSGDPIHQSKRSCGTTSTTDSDSDLSSPQLLLNSAGSEPLRYKEQAVDEVIQLNMIDAVLEFDWQGPSDPRARPILTLVSGDANAGEYSKSGCTLNFSKRYHSLATHAQMLVPFSISTVSGWVIRCLKLGWDVEIIGFRKAISNRWFQLKDVGRIEGISTPQSSGQLFVYTLDEFADELIADVA